MFAYHPVFQSIKSIIKKKILGEIKYVISNFKFPSQDKKNNRYFKKLGNGYFYDAAVYPISLENYLFNFKHKSKVFTEIIKEQVDLRGCTILFNKKVKRFYFWGEGQNYSNNLEIFFNKGSLYVDKFYSKKFKEKINLKIDNKGKSILKVFKNIDHFEEMFKKIFKNYKKKSFMVKSRNLVRNQSKLLDFIKSA